MAQDQCCLPARAAVTCSLAAARQAHGHTPARNLACVCSVINWEQLQGQVSLRLLVQVGCAHEMVRLKHLELSKTARDRVNTAPLEERQNF